MTILQVPKMQWFLNHSHKVYTSLFNIQKIRSFWADFFVYSFSVTSVLLDLASNQKTHYEP